MTVEITKKDLSGLKAISTRVAKLRELKLSVGIHGDAGAHGEDQGLTVAQLAAIHEFGIGVPERSFLRSGVRASDKRIRKNVTAGTQRVIEGSLGPEQVLGLVGEDLVGEIKRRIRDREITQGLDEKTIERKERTNVRSGYGTAALIDTAQLLNSITHKVE